MFSILAVPGERQKPVERLVERILSAEALREHGRRHEVARVRETGFGRRYSVEGELNTPAGRRPRVRSVWQMDEGAIAPRLITAYPLEVKL